MSSFDFSDTWCRWLPSRSVLVPTVVAVIALVFGLPVFLRMPPWCDVTLYDIAARNVLHGGVHYRDVFDTNLPGFVWLVIVIRSLLGWSSEALRAVDVIVLTVTTIELAWWVRRLGGTQAAIRWFLAGVALFYPYTTEYSHCQRDPWMLLPVIVAVRLRLTQLCHPERTQRQRWCWAFAEGMLWGCAVWLKPHALVLALVAWLVTIPCQWRHAVQTRWRPFLIDFGGLLTGGVLIGVLGIAWIVRSGTWSAFWDVMTNWNPEYTTETLNDLPNRYWFTFLYFPPWSLAHFVAIPLAVAHLFEPFFAMRLRFVYLASTDATMRVHRVFFATLYLAWLGQALVLQRSFDYIHLPETLLAFVILSGQRWAFALPVLLWFLATSLALNFAEPMVKANDPGWVYTRIEKHPLFDPQIIRRWPDCWYTEDRDELRDAVGQYHNASPVATWQDLRRVANFLQTIDPPLQDGELTAFHDSTHPLYLMLNLKPSTRYLHYSTAFTFRSHAEQIAAEIRASPQRYIVSDLSSMTSKRPNVLLPDANGTMHGLPKWFPLSQRSRFPWNQPIVFRSNRYLVHRITNPIGPIDIPAWYTLDTLGPGEP